MKIHKFILILFLLNQSQNISGLSLWNKPEGKTVESSISGLVGRMPIKLDRIMKRLKNQPLDKENNTSTNRLILHGPPGNGKSSYAKKLAKVVDAEFEMSKAPGFVTSYIGSGAAGINELFRRAHEKHFATGKRVIIFIDEIDAIAGNQDNVVHKEHEGALQSLWLELDEIKKDPRFFVIVATNKYKSLSAAFVGRFGDNIVEIPNPDFRMRLEVIKYYINEIKLESETKLELKEEAINDLAKRTDGLDIRAIEDIVKAIYEAAGEEGEDFVLHAVIAETLKTHKAKPQYVAEILPINDPLLVKLQKITSIIQIIAFFASTVWNGYSLVSQLRTGHELNIPAGPVHMPDLYNLMGDK